MSAALIGSGVTKGSSNGGVSVTTDAYDTSGASLIVLALADLATATVCDITDNKGNTWVQLTRYTNTTGPAVTLLYAVNPTVGSGHTFTATRHGTTGGFCTIAVFAFSGMDTSAPYDSTAGVNGSSSMSTVSTRQPGSITTSGAGEVVVAALAWTPDPTTISIDGSFSSPIQTDRLAGQHYGIALSCWVQPSAGAVNPTFTLSTARSCAATIAAFVPAAGGGGGGGGGKPWLHYARMMEAA